MVQNYKTRLQKPSSGRGSKVAKVSDRGWLVTNSSRVIQNISRVGKRCTLKMSRAQTFSRWCGVDCLDSESIQRLVWPARSPDLHPVENVWDALGRQVAGRNYPPTNKNTLIRALTEEWDKLPQQLLDNVVQSMVRRVECCITLHGGHIPY
ncbi:transposable element Tcb1 transposase [Trichonephila clavipes]|nr:transposable element Tcb1 transposase [Trichonephila clavipes]